ncbi:OB-fold-containig protein [Aestuariibius sp. 2305UL40-4]|uniref:OB-fold-containig protein n=1 Tax=Aestuariibius violaceus TaxID=3234132 RepID=UPI00345E11A5
MFDLLLTAPFVPFTLALALLMGLLAMELVFGLVGGSILGADADMADFDADLDLDIELDVEVGELDLAELDGIEAPEAAAEASTSPMAWLGLGKVPIVIWFAALLLGFGITGLAGQSVLSGILGTPLNAWIAALPAGAAGLWFARGFSGTLARLVPKTETSAMSERSLGRRMGVVTQGTARRGSGAEVRVTDRHGNLHHLRAEPLDDAETIPQGARVLVLRNRGGEGYRLVRLDSP